MITKKESKEMIRIAKPFLISIQADPFLKDVGRTLLNKIEKQTPIGNLIIELMTLSQQHPKSLDKQEVMIK